MKRDLKLFRFTVNAFTLACALVMVSFSHGGAVFNLLLPGGGAARPPVARPNPDERRLLERLRNNGPRAC